jgi:hypothetical protein
LHELETVGGSDGGSVHLIPQYAVFDNLKKHAPQEAQRLGIK